MFVSSLLRVLISLISGLLLWLNFLFLGWQAWPTSFFCWQVPEDSIFLLACFYFYSFIILKYSALMLVGTWCWNTDQEKYKRGVQWDRYWQVTITNRSGSCPSNAVHSTLISILFLAAVLISVKILGLCPDNTQLLSPKQNLVCEVIDFLFYFLFFFYFIIVQ